MCGNVASVVCNICVTESEDHVGYDEEVKRLVDAKTVQSGSKVDLTRKVQVTLFSMFRNNKKRSTSSNVCTASYPKKSWSVMPVNRLGPPTLLILTLKEKTLPLVNPRMVRPKNHGIAYGQIGVTEVEYL